jgi:hypothetical protein
MRVAWSDRRAPGRMVPALAFANAPRMHNGGWAGIGPTRCPRSCSAASGCSPAARLQGYGQGRLRRQRHHHGPRRRKLPAIAHAGRQRHRPRRVAGPEGHVMAFHEVRFPRQHQPRGARRAGTAHADRRTGLAATRSATPAGPTRAAAMMSPMASAAPTIWRRSSPSSRPATAACTASASRTGPTTSPACRRRRSPDRPAHRHRQWQRPPSSCQTLHLRRAVLDARHRQAGGRDRPHRPERRRADVRLEVDTTTGSVTFTTAPGAGVAITAGFEFDVPVRFDTDMLDVTLDLERLGSITSIPLVEIRR